MKFDLIGLVSIFISSVISQDLALPRPNWYNMTNGDRLKFVNTFKKLNSGPRPTVFDEIAGKHPKYFNSMHYTPSFFAWHRIYCVELEQELKKIDPSVSLPYWDWTVHYNDMDQDPIWEWFGKNGNPQQGNCVTEGQFVDFESIYYGDVNQNPSPHCSARSTNISKTFTGRKEDIERDVIDIDNHELFWKNMESGSHSRVHVGLGGDFKKWASANDPIFWVHHAFVDKIWYDRQQKHKNWANSYPEGPCDMPTYNLTCKDTFDTKKLGYYYEEDRFTWTATLQTKSTPIRLPEPFTPLPNNGTISDDSYMLYASNYILKDILLPSNVSKDNVKPGCELLNLPAALPIEFIRNMKYDETEVRQNERRDALSVDKHNRECLL
jgi:hypothetical protein